MQAIFFLKLRSRESGSVVRLEYEKQIPFVPAEGLTIMFHEANDCITTFFVERADWWNSEDQRLSVWLSDAYYDTDKEREEKRCFLESRYWRIQQ